MSKALSEKEETLRQAAKVLAEDLGKAQLKIEESDETKIKAKQALINQKHEVLEKKKEELAALQKEQKKGEKIDPKNFQKLSIEVQTLGKEFDDLTVDLKLTRKNQKGSELLSALKAIHQGYDNVEVMKDRVLLLQKLLNETKLTTDNEKACDIAIRAYLEASAKLKIRELGSSEDKSKKEVKEKIGRLPGEAKQSLENKNQRNWLPFFEKSVVKKLGREEFLLLSIDAKGITPEAFKSICNGFKGAASFENFGIEEITAKNDPTHAVYHIHRDGDKNPIVKLSHVPESNKIGIVLTDIKVRDEALFLMVVSAKNLLQAMGKNKFHIEHCEEKPEIALKLYLIGKSLGLNPEFKDRSGHKPTTEESIRGVQIKLKIGDKGKEKETSFSEVYQEAKNLNADNTAQLSPEQRNMLRQYIEQLEIEQKPRSHFRH